MILFAKTLAGNVVSKKWLTFAYDFCAKKVSRIQRWKSATENRILAKSNIPALGGIRRTLVLLP